MNNIFDTGFCFWYHAFYKNVNQVQIKNEQSAGSTAHENDFGGYLISELFVSSRYQSFKEEILASGCNIDIEQYNTLIVKKAQALLTTETCKKIKSKDCLFHNTLHYDIKDDSPLTLSHLVALTSFMYFQDFATKFISTFTPIKENESVESIKKRNAEFYHTSKYLRELVQYYGVNNYPYYEDYEQGPFYIPLSNIQNVSSFAIRLNKPILATKDMDVAMRLSTTKGMIIQLNNDVYPSSNEQFFPVSWMSDNPNDKQYLFFGGMYQLKMESVIMVASGKKYDEIMTAYYKFDAMLSGTMKDEISDEEVGIIEASIKYALGDKGKHVELDNYTKKCFHLFTRKKTQIVLHLQNMNEIENKSFTELIMHPIKEQEPEQIEMNKNNLFKSVLFKLFPNLGEIIIYSCAYYSTYGFNLLSLLNELQTILHPKSYDIVAFGYLREYENNINISIPENIKEIIQQYYIGRLGKAFRCVIIKDEQRWIQKQFSTQIVEQFRSQKFCIAYTSGKGSINSEDWLTISV